MARFGDYAKKNFIGDYEMLEEGWHKVEVSEVQILDQLKYQSEETEKKLKVVFETIEEENSNGYPFKVFHWVRAEVDPTNDKSGLHKLILGLFGTIPDNIFEMDIEEDLKGKRTEILVTNKENKDGTKVFSNIVKFRTISNKPINGKKNLDVNNLSPTEKEALLKMLMGGQSDKTTVSETENPFPQETPEANEIEFEDIPF